MFLDVRPLSHASAAVALVLLAPRLHAQASTSQRVQFQRGASSATLDGTIKGEKDIDYVVGASAGQTMKVTLTAKNASTYFNVLAPGEENVAFFIGSSEGNKYEGTLPANGDYRIRVYLMRNAARRNETSSYRLQVSITGAAAKPATSHDAKVPGTDYHATGEVPCSMGNGQPTRSCPFGVKRQGPGRATVVVTKGDGRTRTIFFDKGSATGYDKGQGDAGAFSATKQSDLNVVQVGGERYEIPDAVVSGG